MSAAVLAVLMETSGATRALTLVDRSGLVPDELVIESRPSVDGFTSVVVEHWIGAEMVASPLMLTATQLRAAAAFFEAAAREARALL